MMSNYMSCVEVGLLVEIMPFVLLYIPHAVSLQIANPIWGFGFDWGLLVSSSQNFLSHATSCKIYINLVYSTQYAQLFFTPTFCPF